MLKRFGFIIESCVTWSQIDATSGGYRLVMPETVASRETRFLNWPQTSHSDSIDSVVRNSVHVDGFPERGKVSFFQTKQFLLMSWCMLFSSLPKISAIAPSQPLCISRYLCCRVALFRFPAVPNGPRLGLRG